MFPSFFFTKVLTAVMVCDLASYAEAEGMVNEETVKLNLSWKHCKRSCSIDIKPRSSFSQCKASTAARLYSLGDSTARLMALFMLDGLIYASHCCPKVFFVFQRVFGSLASQVVLCIHFCHRRIDVLVLDGDMIYERDNKPLK